MALNVDNIFASQEEGNEFFQNETDKALNHKFIVKSANQVMSANSTTYADNELKFILSANTYYEITLYLYAQIGRDTETAFSLTYPATTVGMWFFKDLFEKEDLVLMVDQYPYSIATALTFYGDDASDNEMHIGIKIFIKTGNIAGNITLNYNRGTGDPSTVYANSTMVIESSQMIF
jgi:hypothetical protein